MLQTVVNASMDCSGRSNNDVERETDLVEDLSHEEHSDEEMRDCDSIEGQHSNISAAALAARTANGRLNNHNQNNQNHNNSGCGLTGGDIATYTGNNNSGVSVGVGGLIGNSSRSPDTPTDIQMNHHHRFSTSHPLNALGNFMGIGGLHGLPNMSHDDVLEKLKMQVREMKAGLMEQDYAAAHAAAFGGPMNTAFSLPPTSMASFGHPPQNMSSAQTHNSLTNGGSNVSANTQCALTTPVSLANGNSGTTTGANNVPFSFTSPTAPNNTKDVNLASNSSTSSEASNSSQQNNGWSFEEQYKQVRQLYEINDDPKRKEFLDDLFAFMQKRGTPINRLPIMAKSVLDLFELYNLVIARGGLVDVINKKLWQEIIKGLHLPSSITSAAFTLRTQYMKFLYPYECEKKNLSSPSELQAAIDGNRREGRRSSYGQYDTMHSPLQMQMTRQNMSGGMQQMSPLALVTHAAAANNQQAAAAAAAAAHHRLMAPNFGQVPNLMTAELEQRMMEYLKLIQVKKEQQNAAVAAAAAAANGAGSAAGNNGMSLSQHGLQHQSGHAQQRQRSQSPEMTQRDALSALEMSRVALWQMYHNNTSPPASVGASPQSAAAVAAAAVALANNHSAEAQRSEALNLSDSPPNVANIKRERDRDGSPEPCDEFNHQPPAAKRAPVMPAFPGGFWPPGMAAAAAAANFHQSVNTNHDSDMEADGEHEEADDEGEHNTTVNSNNSMEGNNERQMNGHHHELHHHLHNNHHLMHAHNHALHHHNNHISLHHSDNKSDDSAIEHSPTTSGGSASGATAAGCAASLNTNADDDGNISPVSTKKIHLNKQGKSTERHKSLAGSDKNIFDAINLFSSLQFNVKHHGVTVNGEPQLYVNLQLNGIKYSGTLLGKAPVEQSNSTTMLAKVISDVNSKSVDSNINLSGDNTKSLNENVETMKVVEEITVAARKDVAPVTIDANNETSTVNLNNHNNNKSTTDIINEQTEATAAEVESVVINSETPTTTTIATAIQKSQNMHDTELENEDLEEEDDEDDDEETHSHGNSSRCSSPPRPVIM